MMDFGGAVLGFWGAVAGVWGVILGHDAVIEAVSGACQESKDDQGG